MYYGAVPAYRYYTRHQTPGPALYSTRDPASGGLQAQAVLRWPGRVWLLFSHCEASPTFRCQDLLDNVRRRRSVEEILTASQTYLVLAHATSDR